MKELKLPVIKVPMREPDPLSMDEYLKFVEFNRKHLPFDEKSYWKWKRLSAVNVRFVL